MITNIRHFVLAALFECLTWQTAASQSYDIITVNLENDAVSRYLNEVTYTREDTSLVANYDVSPPPRRDIPRPVIVPLPNTYSDTIFTLVYSDNDTFDAPRTLTSGKGDKEIAIYNLTPQRTYYYRLLLADNIVSQGEIHTEGQVRMIYVPKSRNIRDLGGWKSEKGGTIKYGKIIRGAAINGDYVCDSIDIERMKDELGIAAELDMRAWYNPDNNVSAFGFLSSSTVGSSEVPTYYYTSNSGQLPEHLTNSTYLGKWRRAFNFIVNNMKLNRPIYMHCVYGANRTGYMALLLEGLLGVNYDQLIKDYELTYFTNRETKDKIDPVIDYLNELEGETLQDKFRSFFIKNIRVSNDDVDYFISEMLEPGITTDITTRYMEPRLSDSAKLINLQGISVRHAYKGGFIIKRSPDGTMRKYLSR